MSSTEESGVLTEDNVLPQEPEKVADQVANADNLPVDDTASIREDQIQNAINFLSHPKVRGSSKDSKVSFLEKKGLNKAEIEEAFSRLPDNMTGSGPAASTAATAQTRPPPPKPFHTAQASTSAVPYSGNSALQQQPQSLRWTQVVIGASVVAVGVYAVKQMVGPYAARLYRRLYGINDSVASKAKEEENRVAEVVAAAIHSQTSELRVAIESLKEMMTQLDKSQKELPAETGISVSELREELQFLASSVTGSKAQANKAEDGVEKELKDLKLLVAQLAEKPASSPHTHRSSHSSPQQHPSPNGFISIAPPAARVPYRQESPTQDVPPPLPPAPTPSPSYMEVLEMLEKGETPPNVRTDINDQPPNPSQPPPSTRLQPRPKPWERNKEANGEHQPTPHTVITEIYDKPSSSKQPSDVWRPPPIPQASLRKSLPASSVSSVVGDDEEN